MIRPCRYQPWKGFSLIGLAIVLPYILGVPRYWVGWVALGGIVAALKWSFSSDYDTERAIRRLKRMRRSHRA